MIPPMLRLIGFFVGVVILSRLLGYVPLIGPLIANTGILGILLTAMLLSAVLTHYGNRAVVVRRDRAQIRALEAVDNPYNHGKVGSIYLSQGRARLALPHLEQAAAGEPDTAEWHYRLGCARLALGDAGAAEEALGRTVELDDEYAYGAAMLRLGEAQHRAGRLEEALGTFARQERSHGPTPESAYRRGLAHKAMGDKDAARAAFREVSTLADEVAGYQKRSAASWVFRARLAATF